MKVFKRSSIILTAVLVLLVLLAARAAAYQNGSVRGGVYRDINGDGQCVNTGVEGETGVPGINVDFVSSDRKTTVTLYTGDDGTFGLAGAGFSVWEVTARPDPAVWLVTTENPRYATVVAENRVATDINFCISQGANAIIVLPQSGEAATNNGQIGILAALVLGLVTIGVGAGLEKRRRAR